MKSKVNLKGKHRAKNQWSVIAGLKDERIIILSISLGYPKGKLGFKLKAADSTFYFKALAISRALSKDVKGYYAAFKEIKLLTDEVELYAKSLREIGLGGLGKVARKNRCKQDLKGTLDKALNFINNLAAENPEHGIEIITGAKFKVCISRSGGKQLLRVKQTSTPGEVKLYGLAVKTDGKYVRAIYEFQYSTDGGKTWIGKIGDMKLYAQKPIMKIKKLELGVDTLFRMRSNSKNGLSAWCNPVRIIVT